MGGVTDKSGDGDEETCQAPTTLSQNYSGNRPIDRKCLLCVYSLWRFFPTPEDYTDALEGGGVHLNFSVFSCSRKIIKSFDFLLSCSLYYIRIYAPESSFIGYRCFRFLVRLLNELEFEGFSL